MSRELFEKKFELALMNNNLKLIDDILTRNRQITLRGESPILFACKNSNLDTIKLLLNKGLDINYSNQYQETPLFIACKNNRFDIVDFLLDNGAQESINISTKFNGTPLSIVCTSGYINILRRLINAGANISEINKGDTLLIKACKSNQFEIIRFLLNNGPEEYINYQNKNGETPLFIACKNNRVDIVSFLLGNGAQESINILCNGETPLLIASNIENIEMVRILLNYRANIHYENGGGKDVFLNSCRIGNMEIIIELLKAGANINSKDYYSRETALSYACQSDNLEVIVFLLAHGHIENINKKTLHGNSAFIKACEIASMTGNIEIIKKLIEEGADVNQENDFGDTPLLILSNFNSKIEIVDLLLKNGAEIHKETGYDKTPFLQVFYNKNYEILKLFLKYNALNKDNIVDIIDSIDNTERGTLYRKHNLLLFYIFYNYNNIEEIPREINIIIEQLKNYDTEFGEKIQQLLFIKNQKIRESCIEKRKPLLNIFKSSHDKKTVTTNSVVKAESTEKTKIPDRTDSVVIAESNGKTKIPDRTDSVVIAEKTKTPSEMPLRGQSAIRRVLQIHERHNWRRHIFSFIGYTNLDFNFDFPMEILYNSR